MHRAPTQCVDRVSLKRSASNSPSDRPSTVEVGGVYSVELGTAAQSVWCRSPSNPASPKLSPSAHPRRSDSNKSSSSRSGLDALSFIEWNGMRCDHDHNEQSRNKVIYIATTSSNEQSETTSHRITSHHITSSKTWCRRKRFPFQSMEWTLCRRRGRERGRRRGAVTVNMARSTGHSAG